MDLRYAEQREIERKATLFTARVIVISIAIGFIIAVIVNL
jgi:hypothetical protein